MLRLNLSLLTLLGAALSVVHAAATPMPRAGVSTLSGTELAALVPYAQFARAAYCPSKKVVGWKCGEACRAVPNFTPTLIAGNGAAIQLHYVGYWKDKNAVVIAHQGTDPTRMLSDLTDMNIIQKTLSAALFPGIPFDVYVHEGFAEEHAKTAAAVLAETRALIKKHNANTVILVGHSLGGALAELDTLYMTLNLPKNIHVKGVTFGTPRVGNAAWATYFNTHVSDFKRVNHGRDPVAIVPGRFLGFEHVQGEIHIVSAGDAVSCPGNDDATDAACTIKSIPNIADGNILDHLGPYEGVTMGTLFCT